MERNNDIQDELNMLNSTLGTLPKRMPYQVPQDYFEELPSRISLHKKDRHMAPHIVPKGYFDNLPEQMLEKLKQEQDYQAPKAKRIDISWRSISLAAAAVIIILISIGVYQAPKEQPLSVAENLEQVSDDKILAYLEDNIDDYDVDLIKSSLPTTSQETPLTDVDNTTINDYLYDID